MLKALRDFSLGEEIITRDAVISSEAISKLPRGRIDVLKAQRFVEEVTDEQIEGLVATHLELTKRVETIEEMLAKPKRKAA